MAHHNKNVKSLQNVLQLKDNVEKLILLNTYLWRQIRYVLSSLGLVTYFKFWL